MEGLSSIREKIFNNLVAPNAMISTSQKRGNIYLLWMVVCFSHPDLPNHVTMGCDLGIIEKLQ
jgi:hypothetical protein